jgi:soluble lytic murein transglycosylase
MREKALYWYGRSLGAVNDQAGAQAAFTELLTDYPLGYYALIYKRMANVKEEALPSTPVRNIIETLPLPTGLERVKALITLGLYDEAAKELSAQKKTKSVLGYARLYLEMENYAAAINLLKNERFSKPDKETISLWNTSYPLAYRDHVNKNAAANSLPEGLIYSIIRAESSFSPTAKSPVGATGLMQLMPSTATAIAKSGPLAAGSLNRPELNIRFGAKHLKDLLDLYKGDLVLVVAAYNAGSTNVARWQKSFGTLPQDEFIESITFKETREYVKKVLAGIEVYERLYNLGNSAAGKPAQASAKETPAS